MKLYITYTLNDMPPRRTIFENCAMPFKKSSMVSIERTLSGGTPNMRVAILAMFELEDDE